MTGTTMTGMGTGLLDPHAGVRMAEFEALVQAYRINEFAQAGPSTSVVPKPRLLPYYPQAAHSTQAVSAGTVGNESSQNNIGEASLCQFCHVTMSDLCRVNNLTLRGAAEVLGVSHNTVKRLRKEHNIKAKHVVRKSKKGRIGREDIEKLFHLPQALAAESLCVSSRTLRTRCRELGISQWPYKSAKLSLLGARKREEIKTETRAAPRSRIWPPGEDDLVFSAASHQVFDLPVASGEQRRMESSSNLHGPQHTTLPFQSGEEWVLPPRFKRRER